MNANTIQKSRRSWSLDQKRQLLSEAEVTSISAVAKKHTIPSSLLFRWRKQLQGSRPANFRNHKISELEDLERDAAKIRELEVVEAAVLAKFDTELRNKTLSAYNAASGFASLVNAAVKLNEQKLLVFERLSAKHKSMTEVKVVDKYSREAQLAAEKLVLYLVNSDRVTAGHPPIDALSEAD